MIINLVFLLVRRRRNKTNYIQFVRTAPLAPWRGQPVINLVLICNVRFNFWPKRITVDFHFWVVVSQKLTFVKWLPTPQMGLSHLLLLFTYPHACVQRKSGSTEASSLLFTWIIWLNLHLLFLGLDYSSEYGHIVVTDWHHIIAHLTGRRIANR